MAEIPIQLTVALLVAAGFAAGMTATLLLSLRRRRLLRALVSGATLLPALLLLLSAGLLALNAWGYRALTAEEVAVVVETRPLGERAFEAKFRFPDGRNASYRLTGDELYVDARILKWKYWANLLGLHTSYELDRVAGRYRALEDERQKPRTVHTLSEAPAADLFRLRRRFPQLAPLVDAEYGSATFVPADNAARYEIRVSTTGLLARRLPEATD